jgi:hypothetical protein
MRMALLPMLALFLPFRKPAPGPQAPSITAASRAG